MEVPPKPSLRQVLADPRWQGKIYRIWMPVVTLLLFFCLQLQTFQILGVQQPDSQPSSSAVIPAAQEEPARALNQLARIEAIPAVTDVLTETTSRLPEISFVQSGVFTFKLPRQQEPLVYRQILGQIFQPRPEYQLSFSARSHQPVPATIPWQILPVASLVQQPPLPIVHTVASGEGLACIANYYFKRENFYPLLCLYNFGNLACSQSLQPGDQLKIPAFADFDLTDPQINQALTQLLPSLLHEFKTISTADIASNQRERFRGIDYFCQADDYQSYGEELILAGRIQNPEQRIPNWSVTPEKIEEPTQQTPRLPPING